MTVGDFPLTERIVLVTGGGSGLSFEFVKLAHDKGNKVLIADLRLRPEAEAYLQKHEASSRLIFARCDVAKWKDLKSLIGLSEQHFGDIPDVYVAGAGLFEKGPYSFFNDEEEERYTLMDVNASHPIKLTRIGMKASIGRNRPMVMCIVSSMAGLLGLYPTPIYNASKHAVVGFVKSMKPADEEENIKVVAICPGCVDTPLWTDDIKPLWKFDDSGKLSGAEVAETIMDIVEKGEYPGGSVVTDNYYARKQLQPIEEFFEAADFAPLKDSSYGPVRAIFKKERAAGS